MVVDNFLDQCLHVVGAVVASETGATAETLQGALVPSKGRLVGGQGRDTLLLEFAVARLDG